MSDGSTSSTWRGERARGGDIIDLDQYMRGARPPRHSSGHWVPTGDEEGEVSSGESPRVPRAPHPPAKRPSHDSGLSDSSYRQPRRKHHQRRRTASRSRAPAARVPPAAAPAELTRMRAACERALRSQGEQIARVRRFCHQLETSTSKHKRLGQHELTSLMSEESSELSTSSSGGDTARPRDEVKTYKIIMRKLDELNRMLCARNPPAPPAPRRPRPPSSASSSSSVSQCDAQAQKLLSARSSRKLASRRVLSNVTQLVSMPHGAHSHGAHQHGPAPHGQPRGVSPRLAPHGQPRGVSPRLAPLQAVQLDISPHEARARRRPSRNVLLESVVKCESSSVGVTAPSAKPSRLRDNSLPMRVSTRSSTLSRATAGPAGAAEGEGRRVCSAGARGISLCGRCKDIWRTLTGRSQIERV